MEKSWKTTVIGALLAGLVAIEPIWKTGEVDYKSLAAAFLIACFAHFTKDFNVSGK